MAGFRNYLKEAGAELASFVSEGYVLRVHRLDKKTMKAYAMLQHQRNKAIIHLYAQQDGYSIMRNGVLIKRVPR